MKCPNIHIVGVPEDEVRNGGADTLNVFEKWPNNF
jgi:hypothetical protein